MELIHFSSENSAMSYLDDRFGDDCMDNERFAYCDDAEAIEKYNQQQNEGCCGCFDIYVYVGGRKALIGCNYGH